MGFLILMSLVWRFSKPHPCPVWLSWLVEFDNPFTRANRSAVIVENLNLQPGMKVLDAGCGPGRLTIPVAQKVGPQGEVVAMDIQLGMLDLVKKKAVNISNIQYLNAGLGEGKLSHNQFDRALLITVLGEIPDQGSALREIFDALKPSGMLSITETVFDPHFQKKEKVIPLTHEIGFKVKSIIGNRLAYTLLLEKI